MKVVPPPPPSGWKDGAVVSSDGGRRTRERDVRESGAQLQAGECEAILDHPGAVRPVHKWSRGFRQGPEI